MATTIQTGTQLILKDKTEFTSDEYLVNSTLNLWLGTTGGTVYVEVKGGDGVWRTYPELTFSQATAQVITMRRGLVRFRTSATTAITVEVSA